jgi:hypothetical protein
MRALNFNINCFSASRQLKSQISDNLVIVVSPNNKSDDDGNDKRQGGTKSFAKSFCLSEIIDVKCFFVVAVAKKHKEHNKKTREKN